MHELSPNGFLRADGSKGIRNNVLIVYTVNCVSQIAKIIAANFRKCGNVDVLGCESCRANELMTKKLIAFATNPNVGALLIISQGCESVNAETIVSAVKSSGRPVEALCLEEIKSTKQMVDSGIAIVENMLVQIKETPRVMFSLSDLVCACECGGSDYTSGLVANPLVGLLNDYILARGATVYFEEMYEAIGLKDHLIKKCYNEKAKEEIGATYDKYLRYAIKNGQFSIAPGNIRGGLSTIEEKSMGAVAKIGTSHIRGVLKLCQKPDDPGLYYVDMLSDDESNCAFSVSSDACSNLLYAASGAQVCLLTTGRGHVVNNPIIPTIKITGNSKTYNRLCEDIDFDASSALYGSVSMEELMKSLFSLLISVINGKKTKGEGLGHREGVLNFENQTPYVGHCIGE